MSKFKGTVGFSGYEKKLNEEEGHNGVGIGIDINAKLLIPIIIGIVIILIIAVVIFMPPSDKPDEGTVPQTTQRETYNPDEVFNFENNDTAPGYATPMTIPQTKPAEDSKNTDNTKKSTSSSSNSSSRSSSAANNTSNNTNTANNSHSGNTYTAENNNQGSYEEDNREYAQDAADDNNGPKEISVTGISVDCTSKQIKVGEGFYLSAFVSPSNASDTTVYFSSSNSSVASVSGGGYIQGKAAGTATITARAGNKTACCSVTVNKPSEESKDYNLRITPESKTVPIRTVITVTVSGDYSTVNWSVSNPGVAEIQTVQGGTAYIRTKKAGITNVIATTNHGQVKAKITVK